MKKSTFILLINRVYTLLVVAAIALFTSCSKAKLQEENSAEPPKSGSVYAVSYDEAVAELESLLADIDTPTKGKSPRKVANYYTTTLSEVQTKSNADDPFIYIFNFENNEGFAILSGDKRTTPVYAITESGSLNPGDTITNPGLGIALMGINDDIFDKEELNPNYTYVYSPLVKGPKYGPAIAARWGYSYPYNMYVPNGKTGCVATAVAQIMYYYGYSVYHNGYYFDWTEMRKHKGFVPEEDNYTPAYDMIARLMQQLGLPSNLNMDYQADNSWAYDDNVPRTFRNFGYSNGGTLKDYSEIDIINEINAGRPVFISGSAKQTTTYYTPWYYETTYGEGHAWVIDGIMELEQTITQYKDGRFYDRWTTVHKLFYCNWGGDNASNRQNGYFYMGMFNANSKPVETRTIGESGNFQFNLKIITGISR